MIHGGAHSSRLDINASLPRSGQGSAAGTPSRRMRATRARHCSNSGVQGSAGSPSWRRPTTAAARTAFGSGLRRSLDSSTSPSRRRSRRARTARDRSSQPMCASSTIWAANKVSMSSMVTGAAKKIRASRSAPSSSAATMNSDRLWTAPGVRRIAHLGHWSARSGRRRPGSGRCGQDRPAPAAIQRRDEDRRSRRHRGRTRVASARNCEQPAPERVHPR